MLNIDIVIFSIVIITTLVIGFIASRGTTTVRGYAIGDRNFATSHIVSTIVATWASGNFFITIATESYKSGLLFILVFFANFLGYLIIGTFLAPRLREFLGSISIAEAMGKLFGKHVRAITAISGFVTVAGIIAVQLQIAGLICEYVFGFDAIYGVFIAGGIITLYSSIGGIKAVTFTDVMQFVTFCVSIPIVLYFMIKNTENSHDITNTLLTHKLFDYKNLLSFRNPEIYHYISLFLWLLTPNLTPAMFQRIAMSRDVKQVQKSFNYAAFIGLGVASFICMIGILMLTQYPETDPNDLLKVVLNQYGWIIGFKGLLLAGIIAMVMSTVDSHINSSAILLVHDLRGALKLKFIKNELFSIRIAALIIGIASILFALREGDFFELILWTSICYMPIVIVPFLMALFGFRSTEKSVLAGMFAGLIVVVFWELFLVEIMANVGGLIPGMIANLITLLSYHYIFKQKGGWVGIKDPEEFEKFQKLKRRAKKKLYDSFRLESIANKCRKFTPNGGVIFSVGIFLMVSAFMNINSLKTEISHNFGALIDFIYPIVLINSALLISYPRWLKKWKDNDFRTYCWYFTVLFSLCGFNFLTLIMSNFDKTQIIVLIPSLMIVAMICNWYITLASIILSSFAIVGVYNCYIDIMNINHSYSWLQVEFIYILLVIISVIVVFLKPKQEKHYITEKKNVYLNNKVQEQRAEVARASEMKDEFLRNIQHESQTPMTVIYGHLHNLHNQYNIFNEEMRREFIADAMKEATKFLNYSQDTQILADSLERKIRLYKERINLSDMIYEIIEENKTLHIQDYEENDRIWDIDIEDNIMANCDKKYMKKAISNLVENAIKYCKKGNISIKLKKEKHNNFVDFTISDEGCGVPENELKKIFNAFMTSSETRQRSEGKGLGLAVAKNVIELHGGTITAYNNENKQGATFYFMFNSM